MHSVASPVSTSARHSGQRSAGSFSQSAIPSSIDSDRAERRRSLAQATVLQLQRRLAAHRRDEHAVPFGVGEPVDASPIPTTPSNVPGEPINGENKPKPVQRAMRDPRAAAVPPPARRRDNSIESRFAPIAGDRAGRTLAQGGTALSSETSCPRRSSTIRTATDFGCTARSISRFRTLEMSRIVRADLSPSLEPGECLR